MAERTCPGLPADWLNGWLAAVGITVLVPGMTLRWTDEPVPIAVLAVPGDGDPADLIAASWPTAGDVAALPIVRHRSDLLELSLNCEVPTWVERAALARNTATAWTLSSLYTDLGWADRRQPRGVERGQFHTPMPGRDNTVYDRLRKLVALGEPEVVKSLDGVGTRVRNYGLGFDSTRIGSLADDSDQLIDPVVEVLAFYSLAILPVRGNGLQRRQRGWRGARSPLAFRWAAWRSALDHDGIDALLDLIHGERVRSDRVGVTALWEVAPYEPRSKKELTRGFSSRRVEP